MTLEMPLFLPAKARGCRDAPPGRRCRRSTLRRNPRAAASAPDRFAPGARRLAGPRLDRFPCRRSYLLAVCRGGGLQGPSDRGDAAALVARDVEVLRRRRQGLVLRDA